MSQRTSPLPEPTSADASRQGSQASEEPSLTGRCSASEQTLHGGPYPLRQQTSAVEFYDMAVDDEPGDRAASVASETWDEQKVQHISAGLDFLGFVENKKLVPAVSSFRRMLKKSARTAARHKEKEQQDQTKGQRNEALMSGLEVAQSQRHQRRQSVRERSRERQRGSMETVAERLGEAVRSRRSMATLESPLAVVPEEDDVKCEACDACHECEAADPEVETFPKVEHPSPSTEAPRKRFSLPLPRRKTSSCGSLTGTDSEDSMSSAGVSDTSRPSCSGRSQRGTGSSKALDAIFERARAGKATNNVTPRAEGSLSTTASSQGSSPRFVTPLERGALESPKPTMAGAAWVLMQLCKQETPSQEAEQKPTSSFRDAGGFQHKKFQVLNDFHRGHLRCSTGAKVCYQGGRPLETWPSQNGGLKDFCLTGCHAEMPTVD